MLMANTTITVQMTRISKRSLVNKKLTSNEVKREVGGNPGESVAQARVPDIERAPESAFCYLKLISQSHWVAVLMLGGSRSGNEQIIAMV